MLDIKSYDIISPGFNFEIVDSVEKSWIKSSATTKEQKEKNLHDIFLTYVNKLNKALKDNESADVADLVMEKSVYITETTGVHDWPRVETLKVAELHRLTVFMYNYSKYKFSIAKGNEKLVKELAFKAFENIAKLLELLLELSSFELSEELMFCIYNDVFDFYIKSRVHSQTEEHKAQTKEDLGLIIDQIYEETNVKAILKMNQIDKSAQKNMLMGLLTVILDYKVSKYENEEERLGEVKSALNSAHAHLELIKDMSTTVYYEFALLRAALYFSSCSSDISDFKELLHAFKHYKAFRKFRKSVAMTQFFNNFENCAKHLLLLYLVVFGIRIDVNVLKFLKISNQNLSKLTLQNNVLIESLLNSETFFYLKSNGLLSTVRSETALIFKRGSKNTLSSDQISEINEIIYEHKSFLKFNDFSEIGKDTLSITSNFNSNFRDLRKIIDGI